MEEITNTTDLNLTERTSLAKKVKNWKFFQHGRFFKYDGFTGSIGNLEIRLTHLKLSGALMVELEYNGIYLGGRFGFRPELVEIYNQAKQKLEERKQKGLDYSRKLLSQ